MGCLKQKKHCASSRLLYRNMRSKSRSQQAKRVKQSRGQHLALLARLAVSASVVPFCRRYRGSSIFSFVYFRLKMANNFLFASSP